MQDLSLAIALEDTDRQEWSASTMSTASQEVQFSMHEWSDGVLHINRLIPKISNRVSALREIVAGTFVVPNHLDSADEAMVWCLEARRLIESFSVLLNRLTALHVELGNACEDIELSSTASRPDVILTNRARKDFLRNWRYRIIKIIHIGNVDRRTEGLQLFIRLGFNETLYHEFRQLLDKAVQSRVTIRPH